MDRVSQHKIKSLVIEAVTDMSLKGTLKVKADHQGPKALVVFHNGVCRLNKTLEQIRLIGETTKNLGVYRGDSARNLICMDEIKKKSRVRCCLDKVNSAGLEQVLEVSDIVILPTFSFPTATKVARLLCDDLESGIVLSALMKGKTVLAAEDGFSKPDIAINSYLKDEIDKILHKLKKFGVIFCPTEQLNLIFQKLMTPKQNEHAVMPEQKENAALKLITAKDINKTVEKKQNRIKLALNGNVTPLAMDLAKEYAIEIIKLK